MSKPQKFVIAGIVITLGVISVFLALQALLSPTIRRVHTRFLFSQIRNWHTPTGHVSTISELTDYLSDQPIDWNSCSMSDGDIRDGWGQSIQFSLVESGGFVLRSAGPDTRFGSLDDITEHITPQVATKPVEPTVVVGLPLHSLTSLTNTNPHRGSLRR